MLLRAAALIVLAAGLTVAAMAPAPPVVRDKVALHAVPFPLADVRLLDGPFKQAQRLDAEYLLSLEPDRLLHTFRVNAGLPSSAAPLGGWEAPDVELRGHTVGHYLSALALMWAATGDTRFKSRAHALEQLGGFARLEVICLDARVRLGQANVSNDVL